MVFSFSQLCFLSALAKVYHVALPSNKCLGIRFFSFFFFHFFFFLSFFLYICNHMNNVKTDKQIDKYCYISIFNFMGCGIVTRDLVFPNTAGYSTKHKRTIRLTGLEELPKNFDNDCEQTQIS